MGSTRERSGHRKRISEAEDRTIPYPIPTQFGIKEKTNRKENEQSLRI